MPSTINLDAFRFRLRSKPVPTPAPSSSEDDSDLSSPERDQPRVSFHITTPKNGRKSGERLVSPPGSEKVSRGAPEKVMGSKGPALTLDDDAAHVEHIERQSKRPSKTGLVSLPNHDLPSSPPVKASPRTGKPTLIRRVTSRLHISIPTSKSHSHALQSPPTHDRSSHDDMKLPTRLPRSPRVALPVSPTLPNSLVSKGNREAALRERGLLPPCKDLSEQEREADERLGSSPLPPDADGFSAASRLKEEWLAMNRTSQSSASDCASPAFPPHLSPNLDSSQLMSISPAHSDSSCQRPSFETDSSHPSCEGKADLLLAGRPSISSTVPPLSASSYLEVLHEDPSEQEPVTPPPPQTQMKPPIIISTPVEDMFPSSPAVVESPVSCSFPAYLAPPGMVTQPQLPLDEPSSPSEKDSTRTPFPPPPTSRRRTTDSGDRRRRALGPTLSKFGTNSLSNLRRSVVGSLRIPSAGTLSTADLPPSPTLPSHVAAQAPRRALSPTIHSRGSILLGTRDIEDAESRRLSEMAFLD
ncbi:hypothetical protein HYDPIDRAFT_26420 [Hydnomerulius pinastri MD-312]|nr:hypothetical protein HYDPIDRAFT_26420 [Hydnomerulius pinastri MD-312]